MKYQALTNFEGILAMKKGEVRDLDPSMLIVQDLEQVGYIKKFKTEKKDEKDGE